MGDSSVSCALSGITLHGEPAVFIPLFRGIRSEKLEGARLIGYCSQACALFSPMTLPYKGVLDDYGRFEEIHKDENTALIEQGLNVSIEEFTQACIYGNEIQRNGESVPGVGCFIHPEIYQRFSKPVTGGKYAGSIWAGVYAGKLHLETIGCKLVSDLGEQERYRYHYRHPSVPEVDFFTDGKFTNACNDATGKELGGFGLDQIQQSLKRAGFSLFPKEDVAKARLTPELLEVYKFKFKAEFEERKERMQNSLRRRNKDATVSDDEAFFFLKDMQEINFLREGADDELMDKYLQQFFEGKLLDKLVELTYLLQAFSLANRVLMPTICRAQYPVDYITSVITGFIDTLAKKRVRDRYC